MSPGFHLKSYCLALVLAGLASIPGPTAAGPGNFLLPPGLCAPANAGPPRLLQGLILAQARTETGPFAPTLGPSPIPIGELPPLWHDLGSLSLPVTTILPRAQQYFDQGLRFAFAFNHAEAQRSFRAAQILDPSCAMCYWGEALVLGPNINAPMFPEAQATAWSALLRAQALAGRAAPRDQALISALARRYSPDGNAPRAALVSAYADAMADVARRFPQDDTVQALYAEAVMDLSPWNYWEAGGTQPRGRSGEALAALTRVLQRNPDHPGAIHLYLHAVEASADPGRALPYARRLASLMPGAGHLVHMPAHIYYRLGFYRDALLANRAAVAADERYFDYAPTTTLYRNAYYPHNLHFLMVAAQMGGDARTALEAAGKLDRAIDPDFMRAAAVLQTMKAAPYYTHAQFSLPTTILALPDPGPEFILVQAMWHYARAVAYAALGDSGGADGEISALRDIEVHGNFAPLTEWKVPGQDIVHVARQVAQGRLATALGDLSGAVSAYTDAVAVQDRLSYMEPPYWYYPVRQSLGAVLLRAGRLDEAEQAFRDSLARTPNNGWALYGLQQVYRQRSDTQNSQAAGSALQRAWFGDPRLLDLQKL